MALMKDSLWDIVSGIEPLLYKGNADARKKFVTKACLLIWDT